MQSALILIDRAAGDYELWQIVDDGAGGGVCKLAAEFRVSDSGFLRCCALCA